MLVGFFRLRRVKIVAVDWARIGTLVRLGLFQVKDALLKVHKVMMLQARHLFHFYRPDGCDVTLYTGGRHHCTSNCVLVLVEECELIQADAHILIDHLVKCLERFTINLLIALTVDPWRLHERVASA